MNTTAAINLPHTWPDLWAKTRDELRRRHYAPATLRLHRQVLRCFSRFAYTSPAGVTPAMIKAYLAKLAFEHTSWSWKAANICVLRMVFDKLGGCRLTTTLTIPRRAFRLPEILNESEARAILCAGTSLRDRLLLGLLYGVGLKPGEACALHWSDLSPDAATLNLPAPASRVRSRPSAPATRNLPVPLDLQPVLREGLLRCAPGDYIFPGNVPGSHLSNRTLERLIRTAARRVGVAKPVTAMTLRHACAVHLLDRGLSIPELLQRLGHRNVDTTLIYQHCRLPTGIVSPLDSLNTAPTCTEPCQSAAPPAVSRPTHPAMSRPKISRSM
jgi:integrase/recombinase XerD